MRRKLTLNSLDEAVVECRRLLESGYTRNGNWSLGQICRHMRLTIDANLNGYPRWMTVLGFPLRPLLRRFLLPRLLGDNSPSGLKTAPMFVPADDLDDATEVEKFAECVQRFNSHQGKLHAHPGFGRMSKDDFNRFHAGHTAHHLSFLIDTESTD